MYTVQVHLPNTLVRSSNSTRTAANADNNKFMIHSTYKTINRQASIFHTMVVNICL